MKEAVKTIIRSDTPLEINIVGDEHISATPAHLYHPLEAIRAEGCTVIEATTDDVDAPIFLVEEPEAGTDLANAAQAAGTLKHVSIVSGGHAAEIVWHPVENKAAEETPAEEASVEEASVEEAPVEEAPVEEASVEETPAEEASVEEASAKKAPVKKAPAKKTTAKKAPAKKVAA